MFAVNGPSGPTSRNERRVKSDRQREEEEETKMKWTEKKREQFFLEKHASGNKNGGLSNRVQWAYYLAKLVQEHGGNVASMLTSTRITHMVGSNLNGSKADKVPKKSTEALRGYPTEWILQSVKRNKRQPEFEFLVYKDCNAGSLQTAFSRAAPVTK
ncbi:hypothetical protein P3T76_000516 [Phytophthora citrophthora]|uniref:BRCT domain-containing protein n=1 Tax=Phytophthora citrophthora TaxID=4793 RepID=A0AAD9H267_9STRA|nr:hypothetical protein P3T76_000516 [Phytophthora citrophthora]